mgnify:CR=1 FL=1
MNNNKILTHHPLHRIRHLNLPRIQAGRCGIRKDILDIGRQTPVAQIAQEYGTQIQISPTSATAAHARGAGGGGDLSLVTTTRTVVVVGSGGSVGLGIHGGAILASSAVILGAALGLGGGLEVLVLVHCRVWILGWCCFVHCS